MSQSTSGGEPAVGKRSAKGERRRPSGWLTFAVATVAIAAVAIGLVMFLQRRPVPVAVAVPERDVVVRVFGLGTVEARVLSKVGFEVGATLAELKVDHGDRVKAGQVLAMLGAGEQEAKVAKARAALQIAEANIGRVEASLTKAKAVLAQKLEANRRKQALVGRDVVSRQAADEAVRDEEVAKADVSISESEIVTSRAQLADARAQLLFEETMLRHRTLLAPFDAVVIERHKEAGTVVKPGDPILTLVADGSYWGLAYVDEARAGFIAEGQAVEARLRSRPQDTFTGRVLRIGLESDRVTEERRVYVRGENPPSRVHLGEQVEFRITVAKLDQALLVPEAAVTGYDGREGTVWTVEGGRLARRVVKFRHRTEDSRLEVVAGLPEGARLVTRIDPGLRIGRAATVREAGRP